MNTNLKKPNDQVLAWAILFFLSLVWGSSFILIKKALIAFSPYQVGAGRIVIAFLAFLPLFIYHYKKVNWKKIKPLLIVGLTGSGFPAFLYAIAQTEVPSGVAGILNSLTPIFTFLLALLFFSKKFSWSQLTGVSIGFFGCLMIFLTKENGEAPFNLYYALFIVIATVCYGISGNTVGKYLADVSPLLISTVSFVLVGPWVLIYLLNTDFIELVQFHEHGRRSFLALATLSLMSTFGANILYFKLIQLTEPVFSSSVSFIVPIVALMWGFLDGEYISTLYIIALTLIIGGVVLIKKA